jgi:DNA primase
VSGRFDLDGPGGKGRVVESLAPILRLLDPFDREKYIGLLAEQLSTSADTVKIALKQVRRGFNQRDRNVRENQYEKFEDPKPVHNNYRLDEYTLSLIINRPELKEAAVELNAECFARTEDREIYLRWLNLDPNESLIKLLDPVLEERFSSIQSYTMIPSSNTDTLIDFDTCIKRLERRRLQLYRADLIQSQDTDSPPTIDLQNELGGLDRQILETYKGDKEGN